MPRLLAALLVAFALSVPAQGAERCAGYALDGVPMSSASAGLVAVADFNGDGVLDIATPLTILLSRTTEVKLPYTPGSFGVETKARITRSGPPGLLRVTETAIESVRLAGNGAVIVRSTTLGFRPRILAVADFNSDGIDDVVLREGILFGNGDGTFRMGPPLPVAVPDASSMTVIAGDFNGDHHLDLGLSPSFGALSFYSGDGNGNFRLTRPVVPALSASSMFAADIDGDGSDDVIINTFSTITIVPSRGGAAQQLSEEGASIVSVTPGDFNGDGHVDLAAVVLRTRGHELRVWLNDGNGTMQGPSRTMVATAGLIAGDIDGDGKDDLVIASGAVLRSHGDGTFEGLRTRSVIAGAGVVTGDFDGDGDDDVFLMSSSSTQGIVWNDGNGSFHTTPVTIPSAAPLSHLAAAADVDGDGKAELIVSGPEGTSVMKIAPSGDVTTLFGIGTDRNAIVFGLAAGRFTGGAAQVVVVEGTRFTSPFPHGQIEVFDLRAPEAPRYVANLPVSLLFDVVAADINGDERDDIVVIGEGMPGHFQHDSGPRVDGWIAELLSTGASFEPPALVYQSQGNLYAPLAGDFDGDGVKDVAFNDFSTAEMMVLYGDRKGRFRIENTNVPFGIGRGGSSTDLDGDGTDDIVTASGATISLLLGSRDRTFRRQSYLALGSTTSVYALHSKAGDLPLLFAPTATADALVLFPVCARSRAMRP
ncbi:MAG TPA: VCBS repeat-containing protein [Thermoanaerobaculia bacterium]|nr:VCBS repeat-containing protein [Thermoanaerobaculia bacterium]